MHRSTPVSPMHAVSAFARGAMARAQDAATVALRTVEPLATLPPPKPYHDELYERYCLSPTSTAVINTPQYARLRDLKQLGVANYVFTNATHTRYEHALGVAHLSRTWADALNASAPPPCRVPPSHLLAVEVAGLVHDLGHGPLSHTFESVVHALCAQRGHPPSCPCRAWTHEWSSVWMVAHLRAANPSVDATLAAELAGMAVAATESEVPPLADVHVFWRVVVQLLLGWDRAAAPMDWRWDDALLPPRAAWLALIVANHATGVDVDRVDYATRDARACVQPLAYSARALRDAARVVLHDGAATIAFDARAHTTVQALFQQRAALFRQAYYHAVVRGIEQLMKDALLSAAPHVFLPVAEGVAVPLADAIWFPAAWTHCGDWILGALRASSEPALAPARALLARVDRREHFRCLGEWQLSGAPVPLLAPRLPSDTSGLAPADAAARLGAAMAARGVPSAAWTWEAPRITNGSSGAPLLLFRKGGEICHDLAPSVPRQETVLLRVYLRDEAWRAQAEAAARACT